VDGQGFLNANFVCAHRPSRHHRDDGGAFSGLAPRADRIVAEQAELPLNDMARGRVAS